MEINQFALYQLKPTPENRLIRFRSYETLQEQHVQVRSENYEQAYLGQMKRGIRLPVYGNVWKNIRPGLLPAIPLVSVTCWS